MNRRDFIKTSALAAAGTFIPFNSVLSRLQEQNKGHWVPLLDFNGFYSNKGGTIAWYYDKDCAVAVDSQFPDTASEFVSILREDYKKKIDILFNTHHHNDHTMGNSFLKPYCKKIVAHENCVKLQLESNKGKDGIVTADTTFNKEFKEKIGNEVFTATHWGPAHTGGDSIVHFENSALVHMGDLVFNKVYPYIDQKGGGNIQNWIKVLEQAHSHYSNDAIFIFGHAATFEKAAGNRDDLRTMAEYLKALISYTEKGIKQKKKLEDLKKVPSLPKFEYMKGMWEDALAANIDAAYNELKKTK